MTSEGNSTLLQANVHRRPPFQQGLMNFQLHYRISMFPEAEETKLTVSLGTSHLSAYCFTNHNVNSV